MAMTDRLQLPADLILTPVEDLSADLRARFNYSEGDYAVTRPRARSPSRIINGNSAELLREFSSPSTVAQAIIRYARARGASPEATLEEAYPLLERFFAGAYSSPKARMRTQFGATSTGESASDRGRCSRSSKCCAKVRFIRQDAARRLRR